MKKEASVVFVTGRSQNLSGKPDEVRLGSDKMISLRLRFVSDCVYVRVGRCCPTNQQNCDF